MPDLQAFLDLLPEDPGEVDAPKTRTPRVRKPAGPDVDTRAAVDDVLSLMGRPNVPGPAAPQLMLPSARTRAAIEQLVTYGCVETLEAARIDVKALTRDLFDWCAPRQSFATKSVVKAVAGALLARTPAGESRYSHGVEMLSFAAAAAPLLEPDRLVRLIGAADQVDTAFAPERYTMQLASGLRTILARYPDQRREQLLTSLWVQAHQGRWWDMTSGVYEMRHRRVRRDETEAERRQAAEQAVREILLGAAEGTPEAHRLTAQALVKGDLTFNTGTVRLVSALPASAQLREQLAELAAKIRAGAETDPDTAVLSSHLSWLEPAQRPETPLTWLLRTLARAITPDPETGEVLVEALPDKPKAFNDLFPAADLSGFPFPREVRALDRTPLPGARHGQVLVEVVNSAAELAENRDFMGNCTYTYLSHMEKGSYVLLKLWRGRDCYNAALRHHPTGWFVGEINSRFNHGNVPEDIRAGVAALTAALPAPGPLPQVEQREKRQIRYAVA